jgi:hypothetical protein
MRVLLFGATGIEKGARHHGWTVATYGAWHSKNVYTSLGICQIVLFYTHDNRSCSCFFIRCYINEISI